MSDTPQRPDRNGLSRRDFVQGRFLRGFRSTTPTASESPQASVGSLVMRYPKTAVDVKVGDADQSVSTTPPAAARRGSIPMFRPPGAIEESSFLKGCTRCNDCAKACPHDAIIPAPDRFREAAGSPMIEPDHQACLMCEDFPCIAACDENVLTELLPPAMGTAKVTELLCVAHHGTTCTACSDRCPVEGAINVADGKPTVNESECTGCGVCRYVCVAPENAILLMPTFRRPLPLKG